MPSKHLRLSCPERLPSNSSAERKISSAEWSDWGCQKIEHSVRFCQTKEPKHQYSFDEYFYEVTKERHSVRAASRFSLNVRRFESDLCELNRL